MAIRRNKFDEAVEELNEQESEAMEKTNEVVKKIAGTRTRNRVQREKRKALPTYIPESLYNDFLAITIEYGISQNAGVCQAIREYVNANKAKLNL